MTTIHEIAPDLFRLSIYVPDLDMQFNHFLVRDEEPLLFHAGLKAMFPELRKAMATLIDSVSWTTAGSTADATRGDQGLRVRRLDDAGQTPQSTRRAHQIPQG